MAGTLNLRARTIAAVVCVLGVAGLLSGKALGEEPGTTPNCRVSDYAAATRPGGDSGPPTRVSIGTALIDFRKIDDAAQVAELALLVTIGWLDPRLASSAGCRMPLDSIWRPELETVNSGDLELQSEPFAQIGDGGHVTASLRYDGAFTAPHDVHRFPFDSYDVTLEVVSFRYPQEEVELVVDEEWTLRREELTIPDWEVGRVQGRVVSREVKQLRQTHSLFEYSIPVRRRPEFFVYKVILPLVMIVIMSWAVFWIDPKQLAPQMGMASTSMLTLIAFQFGLRDVLPRVGYFTVMDRFILGSSVLVFFALVEAVMTGYLVSSERQRLAMRIDAAARWVFPAIFTALVLAVFGT